MRRALFLGIALLSMGFSEARAEMTSVQPPGGVPVPLAGDANGGLITVAPSTVGMTTITVNCLATSTSFGFTAKTYLHVNAYNEPGTQICFAWNATMATGAPPDNCWVEPFDLTFAGGTGSCIAVGGAFPVMNYK